MTERASPRESGVRSMVAGCEVSFAFAKASLLVESVKLGCYFNTSIVTDYL